jgi:hypothetical protein
MERIAQMGTVIAMSGLLLGAAHWLGMLSWISATVVILTGLGIAVSVLFGSGSPASMNARKA